MKCHIHQLGLTAPWSHQPQRSRTLLGKGPPAASQARHTPGSAAIWYFAALLWRLRRSTAGVKPVDELVD
jgi:hypothetical protein